jgi:hypothetical protein
MSSLDIPRPRKLYRYASQDSLQRSLTIGEFRLRPAAEEMRSLGSTQILPFGAPAAANFLTLSLSSVWDERLFDDISDAELCLVIHDTEAFGERLHSAARRALPNWAGIDAAGSYGVPSMLGMAFARDKGLARQKEWLFAWRPMSPAMSVHPVVLEIGNIESIAELRPRAS